MAKVAAQAIQTSKQTNDTNTGLLQANRDLEEHVADLKDQLVVVRDELGEAEHTIRLIEGEREIHEIQLRMLLAGEETHLSWLRSQKSLFEADAARSMRERTGEA